MKRLLISLAFWLGVVGIHGTELELSETQRRGLQVALEEFHKHPPVQWAFREIGVDSADDTFYSAGTFVKLGFKLQQTSCPKEDWKNPECKIKPNGSVSMELLLCPDQTMAGSLQGFTVISLPKGHCCCGVTSGLKRKRKCLACIKLDPKGKVLGRMVHCPILRQGPQEPQEVQCTKVAQAGEDPRSYFFPGQFAFSRSRQPK